MPQRNETLAEKKNKSKKDESEGTPIDLYIGIFFDGTNNNKYQTMLGKMFRRKEIFEKAVKRQNSVEGTLLCTNGGTEFVCSVEELLKHSRAEVEEIYRGAFTKSELEFLYFGYGNINNTNDKSYNTFIEKKNAIELGGKSNNKLSARPDDDVEREALHCTAKDLAARNDISSDDDRKIIESYKGAAAQNVTYTNVSILESLYKCENKKNNKGEITERHISIYIEGSGADMQFVASTAIGYKGTIGLAGLGLGTGPTGVVSKIRKASSLVNRLLDQYKCMDNVKVKFHFDLFGFSRGATCARVMAYLINPDPNTNKSYTGDYHINDNDILLLTSKKTKFLPIDDKTEEKEIRFMGIFDTVSSIGVKDEKKALSILTNLLENTINKEKESHKKDIPTLWNSIKPTILPVCKALGSLFNDAVGDIVGENIGNYFTCKAEEKITPIVMEVEQYAQQNDYRDKGTEGISVLAPEGKSFLHKDNVKDYGLWATKLAKNVVHVCAMDEVRQNFALVDIESSLKEGTGNSIEVFIPGCHTDIGGGASIGMEDEKIINKDNNKFLTSYYVHSKSLLEKDEADVLIKPISVTTLKEIGWLNRDSKDTGFLKKTFTGRSKLEEDETYYSENDNLLLPSNIVLYRHVTPGYSNVALNFMKENAVEDTFSAIPRAYKVPKDLNDLYNNLKTINTSGRYFVYPKKLEQYRELRCKYIHFSFNEQILDVSDNLLVNGPEYSEIDNGRLKVTSRIIYPGFSDADPKHMFDYDNCSPHRTEEEIEPPISGLNPLLSNDSSGFVEYDPSMDRLYITP